jgi:hypothetical protein
LFAVGEASMAGFRAGWKHTPGTRFREVRDWKLLEARWYNYWVWELEGKEVKAVGLVAGEYSERFIPMHRLADEDETEYEEAFLNWLAAKGRRQDKVAAGMDDYAERNLRIAFAKYRAHTSPTITEDRLEAWQHPLARVYPVATPDHALPGRGTKRLRQEGQPGAVPVAPMSQPRVDTLAIGLGAAGQSGGGAAPQTSQHGSGAGLARPGSDVAGLAAVGLESDVQRALRIAESNRRRLDALEAKVPSVATDREIAELRRLQNEYLGDARKAADERKKIADDLVRTRADLDAALATIVRMTARADQSGASGQSGQYGDYSQQSRHGEHDYRRDSHGYHQSYGGGGGGGYYSGGGSRNPSHHQ